jgi:hypothetical protein
MKKIITLFVYTEFFRYLFYAFIGVIGAGGGVPAAISSAWLLGVRNGFYALRLAPVIGPAGLWKLLAAQLTIDESNAVSAAQPQDSQKRIGFWLTGAAVYVFWNLMTVVGALLGAQIGNPSDWGLDAAAAAAFRAAPGQAAVGSGPGPARQSASSAAGQGSGCPVSRSTHTCTARPRPARRGI